MFHWLILTIAENIRKIQRLLSSNGIGQPLQITCNFGLFPLHHKKHSPPPPPFKQWYRPATTNHIYIWTLPLHQKKHPPPPSSNGLGQPLQSTCKFGLFHYSHGYDPHLQGVVPVSGNSFIHREKNQIKTIVVFLIE